MKAKIEPTNPAYPLHYGSLTGINIRTAIAMDAMNGILAGRNNLVFSENEINEIAENARRLADKLIYQLNNY